MNTLLGIIGLFAVGALVGIYLLTLILNDKETPKPIALIHGTFVITAFLLLLYYSYNHRPTPFESIVLFSLAALGGLVLIYTDLSKKKIPKWLAISHGMLALGGFVFLIIYALKMRM